MKNVLIGIGIGALVVASFVVGGEQKVGGSYTDGPLSKYTQTFSTVASASQKATVYAGTSRLFSVHATSDATAIRYLQFYNLATTSAGFWASKTPVFSFPMVPATASSSPTIVTFDSDFFAPAIRFNTGLVWVISSSPSTYASASVVPARHKVHVQYEPYF